MLEWKYRVRLKIAEKNVDTEKGRKRDNIEWGGFGEKEQQPTMKKDTEYIKKMSRTPLARTQTDKQCVGERARQKDWL